MSAALQYHVKSSPTATSNASHPSGAFMAATKFGRGDFSNPGTNVQSKKINETTMGMYSYQMRRALPVLGLSNDMQVKPVHELIDPILKGDRIAVPSQIHHIVKIVIQLGYQRSARFG